MDPSRILGYLLVLLVALSVASIAVFAGIRAREILGVSESLGFNGTGYMIVNLRAASVGVVVQACGPVKLAILDPRGDMVLYEEIGMPYWERILEPRTPGAYAFIVEGCATLRVYQASRLQGNPGLIVGTLDPEEEALKNRAIYTSIAFLTLAAIAWTTYKLRASTAGGGRGLE